MGMPGVPARATIPRCRQAITRTFQLRRFCVRRTCVHPSSPSTGLPGQPTTWRTRGIIRRRSASPAWPSTAKDSRRASKDPVRRHGRRCSAHWLKPSARIAFRAIPCTRSWMRSSRIAPTRCIRRALHCWPIATGRPIRSVACCFTFMVSTIPRHTRSRTRSAPRCNSSTSGRTLALTWPVAVTTSLTKTCLDMTCSERTCIAVVNRHHSCEASWRR